MSDDRARKRKRRDEALTELVEGHVGQGLMLATLPDGERALAITKALDAAVAERDAEWSDALWPENPEGAPAETPDGAKAHIKALVAYEKVEREKAEARVAELEREVERLKAGVDIIPVSELPQLEEASYRAGWLAAREAAAESVDEAVREKCSQTSDDQDVRAQLDAAVGALMDVAEEIRALPPPEEADAKPLPLRHEYERRLEGVYCYQCGQPRETHEEKP